MLQQSVLRGGSRSWRSKSRFGRCPNCSSANESTGGVPSTAVQVLIKPFAIARLDDFLHLLNRLGELSVRDQHLRKGRQVAGVRPCFGVPQARADHAFWTVGQHMQDVDDEDV